MSGTTAKLALVSTTITASSTSLSIFGTILLGNFHVTNGSASVTTTSNQITSGILYSGAPIIFNSQPGTQYIVGSVTNTTTITLTVVYNGTTNVGTNPAILSADIGNKININKATNAGNIGSFTILTVPIATSLGNVTYTNASGATDAAGTVHWAEDIIFNDQLTNAIIGTSALVELSPFSDGYISFFDVFKPIFYKMVGEDHNTNGLYDSWIVQSNPDFTGIFYTGVLATPLRNITISANWRPIGPS